MTESKKLSKPQGVMMKRTILILPFALILLMFFISTSYAAEPKIEIMGSDELVSLKPGIKQSIIARCISKGVNLDTYPELSVTIFQLGDIISFDAVLDSQPPRAFHSDLGKTSELSEAIDNMITAIFNASLTSQQDRLPVQKEPGSLRQAHQEIDLPFIAVSVVVHKGSIYVSDDKNIYILKDNKAHPWWSTPNREDIFRLYSYQDAIVALVQRAKDFNTYLIDQDKTVQHWKRPVIPVGGSLASSQITSDADIPDGINLWSKPSYLDETRLQVPDNTDFLSLTLGEVVAEKLNEEALSYDRKACLTVSTAGEVIWSSSNKFSPLPLFIEKDLNTDDPPARYYMMPRILAYNGEIVTIRNDRGMSKIFGNIIMFNGFKVLAFSHQGLRFEDRTLVQMSKYYCADIAIYDRSLLALIIAKDSSFVQIVDL